MTTIPTAKVFDYLRGALRGAYGVEDFRGKRVLIIGIGAFGQDLVNKICFDSEIKLFFQAGCLQNYLNVFAVCTWAEPWEGQDVDVIVDTVSNEITVDGATVGLEGIGEHPYAQGIHDFYY